LGPDVCENTNCTMHDIDKLWHERLRKQAQMPRTTCTKDRIQEATKEISFEI
jgi:hypothetical protein